MAFLFKPLPPRPDLEAALARAKDHIMSPEEIAEQRISWVRGELRMQYPEMTFEEADRRVRAAAHG